MALSRRQRLLEIRDMALRLPLGEHGDRCLCALIVELLEELAGEASTNASPALASVRAPAPAPERVGVTAGLPAGRVAPPAGATRDLPTPEANVPDPAGESWLAEMAEADRRAEAEAEAAAKLPPAKKNEPQPAPTPNGGH